MKLETQTRIVEKFFALEAEDTTMLAAHGMRLSPDTYVSEERFQREQDVLFRRGAVVVGTTADVRDAGSYLAVESGGVPIVVVRRADGTLAAYLNACRHRGAPVATGCGGTGNRFVCGFHAWTYHVDDGRLTAQPRSCGGFADQDRSALGLIPVPVGEHAGVVAVRPVGDQPIDLVAELGGLAGDLGEFGLRDYHVHSRTESEWRCNWKLLMDTFLESYHVFALHRATLRDQPGHRMFHEAFGHHMRIPVPFPTFYEQRDLPLEERRLVGHATIQHHLSPNVMLNHVGDYFVMWRFVPLAPDRTGALLTRYWPGPVDDDLAARLARRFAWQAKLTLEEDYPASERIHLALTSGQLPETVLGRNEAAVIKFHTDLQQRLQVVDA